AFHAVLSRFGVDIVPDLGQSQPVGAERQARAEGDFRIRIQIAQDNPAVADGGGDKIRELVIGHDQPAMSHAVVDESAIFRNHPIDQHVVFGGYRDGAGGIGTPDIEQLLGGIVQGKGVFVVEHLVEVGSLEGHAFGGSKGNLAFEPGSIEDFAFGVAPKVGDHGSVQGNHAGAVG